MFLAQDGLLVLIFAVVCLFRAQALEVKGDGQTLLNYCALVLLLSILSLMRLHIAAVAPTGS